MVRSLITGLCIAALAGVIIGLSSVFGQDVEHVAVMGVALGAALGLVPHRPGWGKAAGFLTGFVLAWVGYALRAAVLPDSSAGRAVAAFAVITLIGAVAAASAGRLPLWSGLIGAAAIAGAYESVYTNAPSQFMNESPVAASAVLLTVGLGYLVATFIAGQTDTAAGTGERRSRRSLTGELEPNTKIDHLVTGAGE